MTSDPKTPISKATQQPEDDEPEVEGHRARYFDVEQVVQQSEDDEDDVEGHGLRGRI